MTDNCRLATDIHDQLLATLDEMADVLRWIRDLADHRGCADDWRALVQRLIAMRVRLQVGPLGHDFEDAMDALCLAYDCFVETVLPNPEEH